jgi:hypothetical protein
LLHRLKIGTLALAGVVFAIPAPSLAGSDFAPAAVTGRRAPPVVPKAVPMRGRAMNARSGARGYLLKDLGNPGSTDPADFASGGAPIALNDTGQILGSALGSRFVGAAHPSECVLWTGTRFVNVDATKPILASCTASALTNEDPSTRALSIAGTASFLTAQSVAYLARVAIATGTADPFIPSGAPASSLIGFGPGGHAVGYEYYAPLHQDSFVSGNIVPAVVIDGHVGLLQPQCAAAGVSGCLTTIASANGRGIVGLCGGAANCMYDGRQTTILPTAQGSEFQGTDYDFISLDVHGRALGNQDEQNCQQVPYSCTDRWSALLYKPGANTATYLLPANCANSYAYSVNDSDEVLGYASGCSGAETSFNWTWTAADGFEDLTNAFSSLPGGQTVTPLNKINDLGQILVTIGASDWGVLTRDGPLKQPRLR